MCFFDTFKKMFFSFKIKNQVFSGIFSITLLSILGLMIIMACSLTSLSFSLYRETIRYLDNNQLQEISNSENSIETTLLLSMEFYYDTIQYSKKSFINMQNEMDFCSAPTQKNGPNNLNGQGNSDNSKNTNSQSNKDNQNELNFYYYNDNFQNQNEIKVVFFSPNKTKNEVQTTDYYSKIEKYIKCQKIVRTFFQKVVFYDEKMVDLYETPFINTFIIVDHINNVVYLYGKHQIHSNNFDFERFRQNLYTNTDSKYNYSRLINPFNQSFNFQDKEYYFNNKPLVMSYTEFDILSNSTDQTYIISNYFLENKTNDSTFDNYSNFKKRLSHSFILSFPNNYTNYIIEITLSRQNSISLITTNVSKPYSLVLNKNQCIRFNSNFTKLDSMQVQDTGLIYDFKNCFNGHSTYTGTVLDDAEVMLNNFDLNRDETELNFLQRFKEQASVTNQTIVNYLKVNNRDYRVKRNLFPASHFQKSNTLSLYYPIDFVYYSFYFQDQTISTSLKNMIFSKNVNLLVRSFFYIFFVVVITLGVIFFFLVRTMNIVNKPIQLINEAIMNLTEVNNFRKAKKEMEIYIKTDSENVVEFQDFIGIILDLTDGYIKNSSELLKEKQIKYDSIKMIKENNILVFEDEIYDLDQRSAFLHEILEGDVKNIFKEGYFLESGNRVVETLKNSAFEVNTKNEKFDDLKHILKKFNEKKFKISSSEDSSVGQLSSILLNNKVFNKIANEDKSEIKKASQQYLKLLKIN